MAESIVIRVRRIMSGSVGDLVDAMEKAASETVMREAIREVDRAIAEVRSELGRATARQGHAQRHVVMARGKIADLGAKATFAVEQQRDYLAEAAISRQIDLEAQMPVLETAVAEAAKEAAELERCLAALAGSKHEMEADLAAYDAAKAEARSVVEGGCPTKGAMRAEQRTDDAINAFNRAMNGASAVPGMSKDDRDTSAKLAEIDRIARQQQINDRLGALRQARKTG